MAKRKQVAVAAPRLGELPSQVPSCLRLEFHFRGEAVRAWWPWEFRRPAWIAGEVPTWCELMILYDVTRRTIIPPAELAQWFAARLKRAGYNRILVAAAIVQPTEAAPGSEEKIACLAERATLRRPLFDSRDRPPNLE